MLIDGNSDWRAMDSAPRDGSWIELKCTYGVAPWYCVARWTDDDLAYGADGTKRPFKRDSKAWVKREGGGPADENSLYWRPFTGDVASYIDPTGGAQNDMKYWRQAVARKYGLPPDHFEAIAVANAKRNKRGESIWRRLWERMK